MNLVAKIKRLEMEAAERDKRIAALEARAVEDMPSALPSKMPANPWENVGPLVDQMLKEGRKMEEEIISPPKKRKPRAKTSGTE